MDFLIIEQDIKDKGLSFIEDKEAVLKHITTAFNKRGFPLAIEIRLVIPDYKFIAGNSMSLEKGFNAKKLFRSPIGDDVVVYDDGTTIAVINDKGDSPIGRELYIFFPADNRKQ